MKRVLDKGEVEVIDYLGSDLTVVNSARVSFGKRKTELDVSDIKLIKYLRKHKHFSPFRHPMVQFRIKASEIVLRQHYKHVVGIETTSSHPVKDHAWNELSLRYVEVKDFYEPQVWRAQSDDNKQGSDGKIDEQEKASEIFNECMSRNFNTYQKLIDLGVAKEQARIVLPLNVYSECIWTASFQAIMNYIELRNAPDAQYEIREYGRVIQDIMMELFPITTTIWFNPDVKTEELVERFLNNKEE